MATKNHAPVADLTPDAASLAIPLPTNGAAHVEQADLAELDRMLKRFIAGGVLHQRPDGAFILPNYVDPRQGQIDARGSDCACERCTAWNQYHWYCAGCFSGPHEWTIRQPKGDPITLLGRAGTSGKSYQFCTPDCGRAFRQRNAMPQVGQAVMRGVEGIGDLPIAGGDI